MSNSDYIYVVTSGIHYGKLVRISTNATKEHRYVKAVEDDTQLGAVHITALERVGCVSPELWHSEFICREGIRRTAEVVLLQQPAVMA